VGIPRFVPQRGNYADAFGIQWKTFSKTQLDSYTGTTISLDRARRCVGEENWSRLHDSHVLEAGCGAGRFTEVLLNAGARVTSIDLSQAVEANQDNFPQDDRHRVAQADLLQPPFAPGQFDVVFCLGVVQHTPDPDKAIAKLYEQVCPGGLLVIDHYCFQLSRLLKTTPFVRAVLKRLSPETGLRWTDRLCRAFLPLHERFRNNRLAWQLLVRLSPVLTYYHSLPLSDQLQWEWAYLDTHDALTAYYHHYRSPSQLRRALEKLGAEDVWAVLGGNGAEARCRRPA
jgi:2-polyprenyl-3-methyl-5-hydroxy-6-metoxy-1,4-benzoquinol methylase